MGTGSVDGTRGDQVTATPLSLLADPSTGRLVDPGPSTSRVNHGCWQGVVDARRPLGDIRQRDALRSGGDGQGCCAIFISGALICFLHRDFGVVDFLVLQALVEMRLQVAR